jgi:membrane-bound serine protease (ClpP class)
MALSGAVIAAAAIGSAALFLLALAALFRSRKHPVVGGSEALIGASGETVAWRGTEGRVRVAGEIWRARAAAPIEDGSAVTVLGRDGLVLIVRPLSKMPQGA